jgi:hypothetical protein
MHFYVAVLMAASAHQSPINYTAVFTAGEKDETGFAVNSFRIPGFVVAKSTLVAAAEARLYSYQDMSPHHLVIKRSLDNGRSWLPLQTVVAPAMFSDGTAGSHGDIYYDPTPVFDVAHSMIHIIFAYQQSRYVNWTACRGNNATGPSTAGAYLSCTEIDTADPLGQQLFSVSSSDFGVSWSKPRNLSSAYDAKSRTWCGMSGAGGGNGIQLASGRLVVPGYHAGCQCRGGKGVLGPSCLQSHVLLADTYTSNGVPEWKISNEFFPGSGEGSVAELPSSTAETSRASTAANTTASRLIFVARLERTETHCSFAAAHCAGVIFGSDGGESWHGELDDGQLLDPRCKNTVATVHTASGRQILVHSGAASAIIGQRVNTTLLFSYDGVNWTEPITILPQIDAVGRNQIGGYSALQGLGHGEVGVLFQAQRPPKYHLSILFTKVDVPVF